MAEEDLLNKMEELKNAYVRIRAEKDLAAAEAKRAAEAKAARQAEETEAARRAEEAEYESNWDFHDSIASEIITFRGNTWPAGAGSAPSVFAAEPTFDYTANLNLNQPNLSKPEEGHSQANTPVQSGGESSDSECDHA